MSFGCCLPKLLRLTFAVLRLPFKFAILSFAVQRVQRLSPTSRSSGILDLWSCSIIASRPLREWHLKVYSNFMLFFWKSLLFSL